MISEISMSNRGALSALLLIVCLLFVVLTCAMRGALTTSGENTRAETFFLFVIYWLAIVCAGIFLLAAVGILFLP